MLGRDVQHRLYLLLDRAYLPEKLMEHTMEVVGKDERKGMGQRPGLVQRLLAHGQGLVGVTEVPQGQGPHELATNPGVVPIQGQMGGPLLGVMEGCSCLAVLPRLGKVAKPIQVLPVHHVRP